jgi:hypothetical protein
MPENLNLLAAARSIAGANEIIKSVQVLAHLPNVQDDDTRTLLRRLFETLVHQNEALESLRSAIAEFDSPIDKGSTNRPF